MKSGLILVAAAVPFLVGAAPARHWKQRTIASAAPYINKANSDWMRAIVSGNAAVLSAPYAANAVFITRSGTTVHGKAAIRAMYARRPAGAKVVHAAIHSDGRVAVDPNDVYEWGSAQTRVQRKGKVHYLVGRYLTVWHRSGKRWSITRNIAF